MLTINLEWKQTFSTLKKGTCEKPRINILLQPERLNPFKFRSRMGCLLSPFLFIQCCTRSFSAIRQVLQESKASNLEWKK